MEQDVILLCVIGDPSPVRLAVDDERVGLAVAVEVAERGPAHGEPYGLVPAAHDRERPRPEVAMERRQPRAVVGREEHVRSPVAVEVCGHGH